MTRKITEKTRNYEFARCATVFPPEDERMNIEEMLLGFTINGAKQLGVEEKRDRSLPARTRTIWYLIKTCLRQKRMALAITSRRKYIFG